MRILSYNIHGCIGLDRREDPDRILDVIRQADADIVGLQEVHSEDALDEDFLQKLENLPYHSVLYGKTMRKPTADYGNVLLLRKEPERIERVELPSERGEPRGAIVADTTFNETALRVIVTHLDINIFGRKKQIAALLQHLPTDGNCVLLGDLNEWFPAWPYFRNFAKRFTHISRLRTFPVAPSLFALDRIAISGAARLAHFETIQTATARRASDHKPLLCDLTF